MAFKTRAALAAAFILASASAAFAQYYVGAPGYYDTYGAYGAYGAWGHFPAEDGSSRESFGGY